jgi:hypothetical protein
MKYYLYCICFIFVHKTSLPQLWKTSHGRARWIQYLIAWTHSWKQTRRDAWLDQRSKPQFARLRMHELSGHEPHDQRALSLACSETNLTIRKDSVPMQLRQIKVFKCLVRRAQALCHVTTTLGTDDIREKPLARQTEQGFDPSRRRPWMLYELDTRCPQSWALGWGLLGENPDSPSRLVNMTLIHDGFEILSPWDYAGTKSGLVWGQNPYRQTE